MEQKEKIFRTEAGPNKYEIVSAKDSKIFKNCLVIKEGTQFESAEEIIQLAIANEAFVDNSDDEAADDLYLVQFPGCGREALDHDSLVARWRELDSDNLEE
jgi:hypothetical protein